MAEWQNHNIYLHRIQSTYTHNMSAQSQLQYCRGCNTHMGPHPFDSYKQCSECRLKGLNRRRKRVTCECGRTLLACSLKLHLRSLFHEQYVQAASKPQINKPLHPPPPSTASDAAIQVLMKKLVTKKAAPKVKPRLTFRKKSAAH